MQHDANHPNSPDISSPSPVSRRRLLATAGGIGVAAATVGIVGATSVHPTNGAANTVNLDGPIVVHLADLSSGTLDIFAGTKHVQVRDTDLATRLARAATA
jgi:hypothetical protein